MRFGSQHSLQSKLKVTFRLRRQLKGIHKPNELLSSQFRPEIPKSTLTSRVKK